MTTWSQFDPAEESPADLTRLPLARTAAGWVCVLALGVLWQVRFGTIPDTSWIITMCQEVLAGKRLYVDILETNPPFTIWFYMPVVWLARELGIAPEFAVHGFAYVVPLASLGLAGLVAAKAGFRENATLFAWSPVFLAIFFILAGNAFTEREHLGTALFLPLLALMAWRAFPGAPAAPGFLLSCVAGLAGSVLLLVKPYYAVAVLVPALWVAWKRRSLRMLFAPEHWMIAAVCLLYLAAVARFHPEFLREVYPVLADTYMRVKGWKASLLLYGIPFALLAGLFLWRSRRGCPQTAAVAFLAAAASLLPLFYQGKGWPYHAFPAMALMCVALVCLSAAAHLRRPAGSGRFAAFAVPLVGLSLAWLPFTVSEKPDARLVATVRAATLAPSIALLGSDIADGHPLTRMVGGRWISRYVSDWLGAFALGLSGQASSVGNVVEADRYRAMAAGFAAAKRRELDDERPDLVLVDRDDTFWVPALLDRYGFAAELEAYSLLAQENGLAVYIRRDYRKPEAN